MTNWCFTLNNPSEEEAREVKEVLSRPSIINMVYQLECGKEETPHYQGYIHFKNTRKLKEVKNVIKRAHWEKCKGSPKSNYDYCTKEEGRLDGPWEKGEFKSKGQGNRTDLDKVIDLVNRKRTIKQISEECPIEYIKFHQGIEKLKFIKDSNEKEFRKLIVKVYWGDTGTNKTKTATEESSDYFKLDKANNVWFDGYDGQDTLIIDDFYGWLPFGQLLNILDGYPLRLEIKGGFTWAKWTKVIITSNKKVELWYTNIDYRQQEALERRITEKKEFLKIKEKEEEEKEIELYSVFNWKKIIQEKKEKEKKED